MAGPAGSATPGRSRRPRDRDGAGHPGLPGRGGGRGLAEPRPLLAAGDLPQADRLVGVLRGQHAAVRREGEADDGPTVGSILRITLPVVTSKRLIAAAEAAGRPPTGAGTQTAGDADPDDASSLPSGEKTSPEPAPTPPGYRDLGGDDHGAGLGLLGVRRLGGELPQLAALRRVVQPDDAVGAALGEHLAVRRERQGRDAARVTLELVQLLAAVRVVQADRAVRARERRRSGRRARGPRRSPPAARGTRRAACRWPRPSGGSCGPRPTTPPSCRPARARPR